MGNNFTPPPVGTGGPGYAETVDGALDVLDLLVVSVRAKGATGDGVTDDTQAVLDAIDALGPQGGIVWFPPGTYLVSATIDQPQNVFFLGAGIMVTELRSAYADGPMVRHQQVVGEGADALVSYGRRAGLAGMALTGITSGSTFTVPAVLELVDCFRYDLGPALVQGGQVGLLATDSAYWVENTRLDDVHVRTCRDALIRCKAESGTGGVVEGFGASFGFWRATGLVLNVNVEGCVGIDFGGGGIEASFVWTVVGNVYLDVDNTVGVRVRDNAHVFGATWDLPMDNFGHATRVAVQVDSGGEFAIDGFAGDGNRTRYMYCEDGVEVRGRSQAAPRWRLLNSGGTGFDWQSRVNLTIDGGQEDAAKPSHVLEHNLEADELAFWRAAAGGAVVKQLAVLGSGKLARRRTGTAPPCGEAQLEASVVVVPHAGVTAITRVKCTRFLPSPVEADNGHIYSDPAENVPGVSFTVRSTNGLDTSGLYWELEEPI